MIRMLRVGLTGGIGAGKSTVAARLVEFGAVLIDADVIAREVVEPGTPALAEIVAAFGPDVLTADGALDRPALAAKAFADDESRKRLNAIVHPRVGQRTAELLAAAKDDAIVVFDVPLLVENGMAPLYHLVIVVDAPEDIRIQRLTEVRGMAEAGARARIAAQADGEQRRAVADVWLDNGGSPEEIAAAVDAVWRERLVPFEANLRLRKPRVPRSPAITPYDPEWPAQAARAVARVRLVAGDKAVRVDHIGSTVVPGLAAKDIVDLQLTVSTLDDTDAIVDALSDAGFPRASGEWWDTAHGSEADGVQRWVKRMHYGADPARPINLHVRSTENAEWWQSLLFPAWLRGNPDERDAYEALKRNLARAHEGDGSVDGYAEDKTEWIVAACERARAWAERTGWTPT